MPSDRLDHLFRLACFERMRFTVWRDGRYQEIQVNVPQRYLGVYLENAAGVRAPANDLTRHARSRPCETAPQRRAAIPSKRSTGTPA